MLAKHPLLHTLLIGLALACAQPALAARLALIVGNDSYSQVTALKNAGNDARLMASALRAGGVNVSEHFNLDRNRLYDVVDSFQKRINKGDEVVFYFSGHGVQLDNEPMLLPVDVQAADEKKLKREALPLLYVQDALKDARVSLLVIDACRDNPFPKQGTRSIGETRGLRPPDVVKGQAIIMSAGRNQKALDSVPGEPSQRNGLFTHEFVRIMRTQGLDVRSALIKVRDEVEDKAAKVNHEQRPSLVDDMRGNFYLLASVRAELEPPPPGPTLAQIEAQAWEAVRRANTVAAYRAYLGEYPNGSYASGARVALASLEPLPPPATCADCPELVVLPGGTFQMGGIDKEARDEEKPVRSVNVKGFAIGKYEVTRGQFAAFVKESNYDTGNNCYVSVDGKWESKTGVNWKNLGYKQTDQDPVACVNWNDAQAYLKWLNKKTGQNYRLPTEAEWEYACRGGMSEKYCGSEDIDKVAVYGGNSGFKTQPVGSKAANGFGLYDMSGNVGEWVQDSWHINYQGAPTDGREWAAEADTKFRMLRGGSWSANPSFLRSAIRGYAPPGNPIYINGFRLASTLLGP